MLDARTKMAHYARMEMDLDDYSHQSNSTRSIRMPACVDVGSMITGGRHHPTSKRWSGDSGKHDHG